jgi:hypothetical protein
MPTGEALSVAMIHRSSVEVPDRYRSRVAAMSSSSSAGKSPEVWAIVSTAALSGGSTGRMVPSSEVAAWFILRASRGRQGDNDLASSWQSGWAAEFGGAMSNSVGSTVDEIEKMLGG